MKVYTLKTKQILPISLEEAWEFFSSPLNLSKITPAYMNFVIKSELAEKMYPGMLISYKVSPVAGIPITWVTEITHVEENKFFVDEQRYGPYSMWHHEHHFKELDNGIEMTDIVSYVPPFGILGRIANSLYISKQVRGIFDYRSQVLEKYFPKK